MHGSANITSLSSCTTIRLRRIGEGLCLGQLLALCNALCGILNQSMANKSEESLPACQTALNYVLLCLTYGLYQLRERGLAPHASRLGLTCLGNALVDVEAWYWIYRSYSLTSLTSVQSLDCLGIPVVLVTSRFCLGKRYSWVQYGAMCVSLSGVGFILYSDYDPTDDSSEFGDLMVAAGAALFGISTVCGDWIIEGTGPYQYMGTMCWYALAISTVQAGVLEGRRLPAVLSRNPHLALWMLALALTQLVFYSVMPVVLARFGCGAANINILAADLYAAIAGTVLFGMRYDGWYFTGMVLVCLGIILYVTVGEVEEGTGSTEQLSKSEENGQSDSSDLELLKQHDFLELDQESPVGMGF